MGSRFVATLLALPVLAAACPEASAQVQVPDGVGSTGPAVVGGAEYGVAGPPGPRSPLRVTLFSLTPGSFVSGTATVVRVRVDGGRRRARLRVVLVPEAGGRPLATLQLGWRRTGIVIERRWTPRRLPAGAYVARVHAVDTGGTTLKRTPGATGKLAVQLTPRPAAAIPAAGTAIFPVRGPWSFGGDDARFGAARDGHVHQGQDIAAAEGTPLVSPLAGVVYWRAVQDAGAGHYLVIRGADGRDYVFMHLVAGSERVVKGETVTAGEVIGAVGHTGDASGSHLHFEIWPDGWYAPGSHPIDPLPDLQRWAAASG